MRKDKAGRPPKDKLTETIVELNEQGFSITEIAEKIGRARSVVHYHIQKARAVEKSKLDK